MAQDQPVKARPMIFRARPSIIGQVRDILRPHRQDDVALMQYAVVLHIMQQRRRHAFGR